MMTTFNLHMLLGAELASLGCTNVFSVTEALPVFLGAVGKRGRVVRLFFPIMPRSNAPEILDERQPGHDIYPHSYYDAANKDLCLLSAQNLRLLRPERQRRLHGPSKLRPTRLTFFQGCPYCKPTCFAY
jgi:hypothetical protein